MQTRFSDQYDNDNLTSYVVGLVWAIALTAVVTMICAGTGVLK